MRCLALVLLVCAGSSLGCFASRQGWGRGNFVVLLERDGVQMRRSLQRVDPKTGELWINWIGVRMQQPDERVLNCQLTAFEDANQNGRPDVGEIRAQRSQRQSGTKTLFDEFRLPQSSYTALHFELQAHTTRGDERVVWDWRAE